MNKILKCVFATIAAIVAAVVLIWFPELRTAAGVEQIGPNKYLYRMDYKATYDIDKVMAANIDENKKLVGFIVEQLSKGLVKQAPEGTGEVGNVPDPQDLEKAACTSFQAALEGGGFVVGRNYDYFKNPSIVTITHPKQGYRSIACSDLSHLGYSLEKLPNSLLKKVLCVAAVYCPMDGMNEKGLVTSILALPKQAAQQRTGKPCLGTSTVMRAWLEKCATVDEAIELLSQYDIRHDATVGSGYHYFLADAAGNSAIVEFDLYDNWKTMIVRKDKGASHQLVTNHLMSPKYRTDVPDQILGNTHSKSWERFAKADAYLSERGGILSSDEALECLSLVHWKDYVWEDGSVTEDTQYSAVYDQSSLTLKLRSWADYDTTVEFAL